MTDVFKWKCPYCNHASTISNRNRSIQKHVFAPGNSHNRQFGITTTVTVCPNPACREYTVRASLHKVVEKKAKKPAGGFAIHHEDVGRPLSSAQLRPQSRARTFPSYIPRPILDDYAQASLIKDLSPTAAAALARRCLRGIIRDYWGISKNRMIDEIDALQSRVDEVTWQAIDSVRRIGNIGAHMGDDANKLVDTDPDEADLLLDLIEIVIEDWYIARHEREKHLESIVAITRARQAQKRRGET